MAYQPLTQALGSKIAMKLQGKSVVDNSAKSAAVQARVNANAPEPLNAQNKAVQKGIDSAYGAKSRVKAFGTPLWANKYHNRCMDLKVVLGCSTLKDKH